MPKGITALASAQHLPYQSQRCHRSTSATSAQEARASRSVAPLSRSPRSRERIRFADIYLLADRRIGLTPLAKARGNIAVKGAQRGGFGAFGAAGAALCIPGHHIEMRPRDAWLNKFLKIECGSDRAGVRPFRHVIEVGDLAVDHLPVRPPQRHPPHRVRL